VVSALRLEGADAPAASGAQGHGAAEVRFTGRTEGDMADPTGADPDVASRRRSIVDRPWTWLRQVHGARVVVVDAPGGAAGEVADAAVSAAHGAALAILTADCAPVALASPEGVIGAVHAGWRGLANGVVSETVAAMRSIGATTVVGALGPCIGPECYEFGELELEGLVARFGPGVRARDRAGAPALDLRMAVRAALSAAGAELVTDAGVCTACSRDHWSWRARGDRQRQAMVVWRQ
jgi:polyphenol oxidase